MYVCVVKQLVGIPRRLGSQEVSGKDRQAKMYEWLDFQSWPWILLNDTKRNV